MPETVIMSEKPLSLREAQNLIRGSANPFPVLSRVRRRVKFSELPSLVAWLPSVRHAGRGVFREQFPADVSELRRNVALQPVGFDREVAWTRLILSQHGTRLKEFLHRTREYERDVAAGQNNRAMAALGRIEADFGASLWVIENRIALLQLAEGLDKQKAYLADVRSASANSLVAFIAFYISNRNEEAITPARFAARLSDQLKGWEIEADLQAYVRFRIANQDPRGDAETTAILRYETSSAIVDQYDTFIRVAQAVALRGSETARRRFLVELRQLDEVVADLRIKKLLLVLGAPGNWSDTFVARDVAPFSAELRGDFPRLSEAALRAREKDPTDSSTWFFEAQASLEMGSPLGPDDGSLRARVTSAARSIIARTDESKDATLTLSRIAFNFTLMSFAKEVPIFLAQHVSSEAIADGEPILGAFLDSPYLDPRALRYLPTVVQGRYADTLRRTYDAEPAVLSEIGRAGFEEPLDTVGLSPESLAEIETERLIASGDYSTASNIARGLRLSHSATARRRGRRYEALCLLRSGEIEDAIDLVVSVCLTDPGMTQMLPIRECAESLNKRLRKRLAAKVATPIVLDLYSRHVDDRLDNIRAYAYEDFLIANGLERPAQVADVADRYDAAQLVYYLRHICVPSIMQVSSVFRGTRDVEEERLQVASLLARIDVRAAESYETEIREIKRNQLIERGVRHVEQSKIFVDFVAIKKWAERELKEGFLRYQALLRAGVGGEEAAFNKAIQDALGGAAIPQEFLELPKNEAIDLLIGIVYALVRECTANPEYGLDCYLSMRIRHGTLSGQLRSPLEGENVITQRNELREYASNAYWMSRLGHLDWSVLGRIDARLRGFSQAYDTFIDRIANELVQIKSKDKRVFVESCG